MSVVPIWKRRSLDVGRILGRRRRSPWSARAGVAAASTRREAAGGAPIVRNRRAETGSGKALKQIGLLPAPRK
eukprot:2581994-Pyramimonas_sp.AAC.1